MMILEMLLLCLLVAVPASAVSTNHSLNILGGEDVSAGDFNYVVGLSMRSKRSRVRILCSGSIINARWILTASHCLEESPSTHYLEVSVGSKILSRAHVIQAEKWYKHEHFIDIPFPTVVFNDIGLVKLKEPVTGIANTAFATLPSQNEGGPSYGSTVTIVGFGVEGEGWLATNRRSVLKQANMRVSGLCLSTLPYCIAAVDTTGRACPGDSGGPMVYQGKVVGVASTGSLCTRRRGDGQYTTVSRYINWINDKIKQG